MIRRQEDYEQERKDGKKGQRTQKGWRMDDGGTTKNSNIFNRKGEICPSSPKNALGHRQRLVTVPIPSYLSENVCFTVQKWLHERRYDTQALLAG